MGLGLCATQEGRGVHRWLQDAVNLCCCIAPENDPLPLSSTIHPDPHRTSPIVPLRHLRTKSHAILRLAIIQFCMLHQDSMA